MPGFLTGLVTCEEKASSARKKFNKTLSVQQAFLYSSIKKITFQGHYELVVDREGDKNITESQGPALT